MRIYSFDLPVITRNFAKMTDCRGVGSYTLDEKIEKHLQAAAEIREISAERAKPRAIVPDLHADMYNSEPVDIGNGTYYMYDARSIKNGLSDIIYSCKNSGIKRVIDTRFGASDFLQDGIEVSFVNFDFHGGFLNNPPYIDANSFLERRVLGMRLSDANRYRKANREQVYAEYQDSSRAYIERFIKFIQNMQKGNCFVRGCLDSNRRCALIFNKMFNPMAEPKAIEHVYCVNLKGYMLRAIRNLYNNLTELDKQRLGWKQKSKEERFLNMLDENGRKIPEYDLIK